MAALTRTQLDALAHLHATGRQKPVGSHYSGARYSYRTLQALVSADLSRWVGHEPHSDGVMPHVVPTQAPDDSGELHLSPVYGADVARAILTGALWCRFPQAYIDGDRVSRVTSRDVGVARVWHEV